MDDTTFSSVYLNEVSTKNLRLMGNINSDVEAGASGYITRMSPSQKPRVRIKSHDKFNLISLSKLPEYRETPARRPG